jgi:hypothetical protein
MTEQRRKVTDEWDLTQWASVGAQPARADNTQRWTLWEWASTPYTPTLLHIAVGDSALSGYGHNPSGQRWWRPR